MGAQQSARIGLEVHAQLDTRTKMFCGCRVEPDSTPNSHTCPVCTGLPGALPVPNRKALQLAVRTGLALKATLNQHSRFDRKHYLYPDLPKGYQITQQQVPLFTGGTLPRLNGTTVPLSRIHLEEDAARSRHTQTATRVDFNRSGIPLLEVVTEPVLTDGKEAQDTVRSIRSLLRYLHVCSGEMQFAQLRCDANVSLTDTHTDTVGTRVEIKNLNSLRHIQKAVDAEIDRQRRLLRHGEPVIAETRLYDEQANETRPMRVKESIPDYRYMPEPDIPMLALTESFIRQAEWAGERPHERVLRWVRDWELTPDDAIQLAENPYLADFVEQAVQVAGHVQPVCSWIRTDVLHLEQVHGEPAWESRLSAQILGELAALTLDKSINERTARNMIGDIWTSGESPETLIERRQLKQVSGSDELAPIVNTVLRNHPDAVEKYGRGERKVIGFLMGQVMERTDGRADPVVVRTLLEDILNG